MDPDRRQSPARHALRYRAPLAAATMILLVLCLLGSRVVQDVAQPVASGIRCIGSLPKAVIQGDTLPLLDAIGILMADVAGDASGRTQCRPAQADNPRDLRSRSEPDTGRSEAHIPRPAPTP